MKRKYIAKFKRLYQIFPLFFWYKCNKCDQEFRRERGWRALDVPQHNLVFSSYYLCKSCAPTREIAHKYFLSGEHKKLTKLKNWPPPTPLPPKSVKRAEGKQPDRRQWQSGKKYTGQLRRNLSQKDPLDKRQVI